ncbi:MCE family protein [Nocardioides taihuensis]|uniref:MCE family protein n=1 Tax=Nocardioides taihuensis TaxID=1835606 RepID=A0ABW0BHL6_9ACTN
MMTRLKALLLLLVTSVALSGCDFDVYELPLPGGTDVGDDPIMVTVKFRDVLDLVPRSTVKVNDVNVGQVTDITLDGYTADVTLALQNDVDLPDNAIAELRQTSLLGEKFVSLSPPPTGATGQLESGDVIGLDSTGRNPEVEEVLGALSLILNGGGVAQLQTIAPELNQALEGREDSARSVLRQVELLTGQLDDNKEDIVRAIDSLNRLAVSVNDQTSSIDSALEELPSALETIDKQRGDLVRMLQSLNRLGDIGVRVINASEDATIQTVRQLDPVLTELANSGKDFVDAFNVFLTYPFVDEVVGRDPQVARNLHMGDYTNLSVELDVNVGSDENDTGLPDPTDLTDLPTVVDPTVVLGDVAKCLRSGKVTSKACQRVLKSPEKLLKLREECAKPENEDKPICTYLVNQVPGLPSLPSLPGLPGLPRVGYGPSLPDASYDPAKGPTMGWLLKRYDPALVSLLVPGMVTR